MKYNLLLYILFSANLVSYAQNCDYTTFQYATSSEMNVVYGISQTFDGSQDTLRMNIFKPVGDLNTQRPLIVFVHGGGWTGGDKDDANPNCELYAQRGFVAVTIDYRLGFFPDTVNGFYPYIYDEDELIRVIYRGMQDTKGAIRFMKDRSALDSTDVNTTVLWGGSAGGFIVLAATYLDKVSEKPAACYASTTTVYGARPDLGPVEGTLNINGYNTNITAVANCFGGITDTSLIETANDPPIFNYHQTLDSVVSCYHDQIFWDVGFGYSDNYADVMGSCIIGDHLDNLGYAPNRAQELIYTGLGTPYGHGFHDFILIDSITTAFYNEHICTNGLSFEEEKSSNGFKAYPNPFSTSTTLEFDTYLEEAELTIFDMNGRLVRQLNNIYGKKVLIQRKDLLGGVYTVRVRTSGGEVFSRNELLIIMD